MGHLQEFYCAADLAFVGASLVRRGGHNVLEAGAVGVPVVFGPHMFNFEEIAAGVVEAGAGKQVYDETELEHAVELYISNPGLRAAAGDAARSTIACNRGSVGITLECMATEVHRRIVQRDEASAQTHERAC
jgi:3-deoxy-D-manno-octulosonic-acid transferase